MEQIYYTNLYVESEKARGNGTFHNSILVQPEGCAFFRASVFCVELDELRSPLVACMAVKVGNHDP